MLSFDVVNLWCLGKLRSNFYHNPSTRSRETWGVLNGRNWHCCGRVFGLLGMSGSVLHLSYDILFSINDCGIPLQAIIMKSLLFNQIYVNNICSQDDVLTLRIDFTMHNLINVFWITKFVGITVTEHSWMLYMLKYVTFSRQLFVDALCNICPSFAI